MKIHNVKLSALRNHEHFNFMTEFRGLVNRTGAAALGVKVLFDPFLALYAQEDEVLQKIAKSAITDEVHEADMARDRVFRGMVDAVKSALNHFKPEIHEAARRVGIVLDEYGNVAKMTLHGETSAIYNLMSELLGKHGADTEALGLGAWITELDRRNVGLEKLLVARRDEGAAGTELVLKEVRKQIDDSFRNMAQCVESMAMMSGGGEAGAVYTGFIHSLNAQVDEFNRILAQRAGRAAKNGDKGGAING